jgi:hypothetical protein
MKKHPLNPDARKLEEKFFAEENRLLLQRLREKSDLEARRAAMREVMPTADDAFVDHMLELGIGPETALAVTFLPLVMVAWADGEISPKERDALLKAAEERGVTPGSAACEVLGSWLEHKPGSELTEAWKRYVQTMRSDLSDEESGVMRERMLGLARGVAEAAGGFLGLTSKISEAEQKVLDELERALS